MTLHCRLLATGAVARRRTIVVPALILLGWFILLVGCWIATP